MNYFIIKKKIPFVSDSAFELLYPSVWSSSVLTDVVVVTVVVGGWVAVAFIHVKIYERLDLPFGHILKCVGYKLWWCHVENSPIVGYFLP